MPAHRRLRHASRLRQFSRTMGASAEKLDHTPSSRVGQSLKRIHYQLIVNDIVIDVNLAENRAGPSSRTVQPDQPARLG